MENTQRTTTTQSYDLELLSIPNDYKDLNFEEKITPSKSNLLNDDLVKQKIKEGIKVASVYLPKRFLNPEEIKTDLNDFFNNLPSAKIIEIYPKFY